MSRMQTAKPPLVPGNHRTAHLELWESIREDLRDRIIGGHLPPGSRLVEEDLAKSMEVSRGPVRRALTDLDHRGLVESLPRRGTRVVVLGPDDVSELYYLRKTLEVSAVRKICEETKPKERARLASLVDTLESAVNSYDSRASIRADVAFHRELVHIAGNSRLSGAWEAYADQVALAMSMVHRIAPNEWLAQGVNATWADHRLILEALVDGEPDQVVELLEGHLERASRLAVSNLRDATRS